MAVLLARGKRLPLVARAYVYMITVRNMTRSKAALAARAYAMLLAYPMAAQVTVWNMTQSMG